MMERVNQRGQIFDWWSACFQRAARHLYLHVDDCGGESTTRSDDARSSRTRVEGPISVKAYYSCSLKVIWVAGLNTRHFKAVTSRVVKCPCECGLKFGHYHHSLKWTLRWQTPHWTRTSRWFCVCQPGILVCSLITLSINTPGCTLKQYGTGKGLLSFFLTGLVWKVSTQRLYSLHPTPVGKEMMLRKTLWATKIATAEWFYSHRLPHE